MDLCTFTPCDKRAARQRAGLPDDEFIVLFVGRIQPLKAPDVLVKAVAQARAHRQDLKVRAVICGGPSGSGLDKPTALMDLTRELGMTQAVTFLSPTSRDGLADLYRAADVTMVPSHSESFGLVAVESQACGTPVIAAAVGGLRTAVANSVSGYLIDGHDPRAYSAAIERLADDPALLAEFGRGAVMHAAAFGWEATTVGLLNTYRAAMADQRSQRLAATT